MKINFKPLIRFVCTDCENSEFALDEDVWGNNAYCPYCGEERYTKRIYRERCDS